MYQHITLRQTDNGTIILKWFSEEQLVFSCTFIATNHIPKFIENCAMGIQDFEIQHKNVPPALEEVDYWLREHGKNVF